MTLHQQIFAISTCVFVLICTVELVRLRKLKEEYSVLWLLISALMFLSVLFYDILEWLTNLIGAVTVTTTLFLSAIIFLILVAMQFSIKISQMSDRIKNLAQDNAILRAELTRMKPPGSRN